MQGPEDVDNRRFAVKDIVIYGTRGMGRDTLSWMADAGEAGKVKGFVTHYPDEVGGELVGLPIVGDLDYPTDHPEVGVVLAAGSTPRRIEALERYRTEGIELVTVVHPTVVLGARTVVGEGSILCPGVIVGTDATIGDGVILNYGALVGHDCRIGDGAFIAPGAHLAGTVDVGPGAHVGLGASVVQKLAVGARAMVGAGAVVVRDVAAETTVVGVPAEPLDGRSGV